MKYLNIAGILLLLTELSVFCIVPILAYVYDFSYFIYGPEYNKIENAIWFNIILSIIPFVLLLC